MKLLLALALFISLGAAAPPVDADGAQTIAAVSQVERPGDVASMFAMLNETRTKLGLQALVIDQRLGDVAHAHAVDMIVRHYFAHETPEGASPFDRMTRAGCRFGWAGENMAIDSDADSALHALYASAEHRENMLNPHYHRVGIAVVPGSSGEVFVQDFSD